MKIIIIRHGDPDNINKTLTPTGFKEVEALGEYLKDLEYTKAFCSPLPRAVLTSQAVLKHHSDEATICPWLQEFSYKINVPYKKEQNLSWDLYPSYFKNNDNFYLRDDKFFCDPCFDGTSVKEKYDEVISSFDNILKEYGYERDGHIYKVNKENKDTLVFFCHLGMMSLLTSHLTDIPYMALVNSFFAPPSSITTFISEERQEGIAQFRLQGYGDISHLSIKGLKPSYLGRFCEIYHSDDRHE